MNLSSLLFRVALFTLSSLLLPPTTLMVALPSLSARSILLISSTCLSRGLVKFPVRWNSKSA